MHERDPDARARLWRARHDAAHALAARFPGTKERTTDVCVPLTELAARRPVRACRDRPARPRRAASSAMPATATSTSPSRSTADDPAEIARSDELVRNVVDDALARGGTCTGEHGIGLGKIGALEQEHGDLIPLMRAIKQASTRTGSSTPARCSAPLRGAK